MGVATTDGLTEPSQPMRFQSRTTYTCRRWGGGGTDDGGGDGGGVRRKPTTTPAPEVVSTQAPRGTMALLCAYKCVCMCRID